MYGQLFLVAALVPIITTMNKPQDALLAAVLEDFRTPALVVKFAMKLKHDREQKGCLNTLGMLKVFTSLHL